MIIRTVLAVAAVALGVTTVTAQQDPIAARKAIMKANGEQAGIGAKMNRGEEPFDLAKAKKIFVTYQEVAKTHALWPDSSKTGARRPSSSSPQRGPRPGGSPRPLPRGCPPQPPRVRRR